MILTVCIPTYNRPQQVKNTILRLIPQLNENVNVLILDNCSDVNIHDHLNDTLREHNMTDKINILRNKINIGPDANFAKCFELCETPYIWTLSDDDEIEGNAIELILAEIEIYKDCDLIGFNFNSNCNLVERKVPVFINNTHDLAYKLDFFGNWLFISTAVYKTQEYLKFIRYAVWSAYSMCSQIVPAMMAISTGKTFILSEKYIVTNIPLINAAEKWSNIQICYSLPILLETPVGFKKDEYRAFGQKMQQQFEWFADVLYTILKSVDYNIDLIDDYHIYIYKQIYSRTFEFRIQKVHQWLQYQVGLGLLKNKILLKMLWKTVPRIKTKSMSAVPFYLFKR